MLRHIDQRQIHQRKRSPIRLSSQNATTSPSLLPAKRNRHLRPSSWNPTLTHPDSPGRSIRTIQPESTTKGHGCEHHPGQPRRSVPRRNACCTIWHGSPQASAGECEWCHFWWADEEYCAYCVSCWVLRGGRFGGESSIPPSRPHSTRDANVNRRCV